MTTRQRLLNLFMEEYYPELTEHFRERDFLHSAYVTVFELPEPTQRSTFGHLVSNSYHRCRRNENRRAMHFIVPDPLFWLMQADTLEEPQKEEEGRPAEDEEREKKNVHSFLRSMFNDREVLIYDLVMNKNYDVKSIAELTGMTKSKVEDLLDRMEDAIRNDYSKPRKRKSSSK